MYNTVTKIKTKSFSNGQNFHVGMKGMEIEMTSIPGFTHKMKTIHDPVTGYIKSIIEMVPEGDLSTN